MTHLRAITKVTMIMVTMMTEGSDLGSIVGHLSCPFGWSYWDTIVILLLYLIFCFAAFEMIPCLSPTRALGFPN